MREGVGKMLYADRGDMYEGEWMADQRHGRGTYYRCDGRADVATYVHHDTIIGEGTQWSPNREFVVRLVGGVNQGPISVEEALEICRRMGVPGVPKRYCYDQPRPGGGSGGGSVNRSTTAYPTGHGSKQHFSSATI